MGHDADKLREQVRIAFAETPKPARLFDNYRPFDVDHEYVMKSLDNLDWQRVSVENCVTGVMGLVIMSMDAVIYYLPAFLDAVLVDTDTKETGLIIDTLHFIMSHPRLRICQGGTFGYEKSPSEYRELVNRLTPDQKKVIVDILRFIASRIKGSNDGLLIVAAEFEQYLRTS